MTSSMSDLGICQEWNMLWMPLAQAIYHVANSYVENDA